MKIIANLLVFQLLFSSFTYPIELPAYSISETNDVEEKTFILDYQLEVSKNLLFNKNDVDAYLDDKYLTTIAHGESYSGSATLSQDIHTFTFTLKGDTSISCKKTFRLNRDKNCVLSIHTGNEEISIIRSDITYKDASFDSMNYELVFRFSKRNNYHFHEEIAIDFDNQTYIWMKTYVPPRASSRSRIELKSYDVSYFVPENDDPNCTSFMDKTNNVHFNIIFSTEGEQHKMIVSNSKGTYTYSAPTNYDYWLDYLKYMVQNRNIKLQPEEDY